MADVLPVATIVHAMSGRTRLRIADRRGEDVFFAAIATGLSAIPGVTRVEVRPLTGSILVQHGPPLARIAAAAEQARLFVLRDASPPSTAPVITIKPEMVMAAGFSVFALWQMTQGRILPPAITLAWYAAALGGLMPHGEADDGE